MIAKLTGRVDSIGADTLILDVNGVGYLLTCSGRALSRLAHGEKAALLVETFVRDERIVMYGFADSGERDWFRLLTTVQGVGPKAALAILSVLDPEGLTRAIACDDKTALVRADGVGPKLALRILNELKDKAGNLVLGAGAQAVAAPAAAGKTAAAPAANAAPGDAVSALVNLGYGRSEAFGAVMNGARTLGPDAVVGDLIRFALKELAQ